MCNVFVCLTVLLYFPVLLNFHYRKGCIRVPMRIRWSASLRPTQTYYWSHRSFLFHRIHHGSQHPPPLQGNAQSPIVIAVVRINPACATFYVLAMQLPWRKSPTEGKRWEQFFINVVLIPFLFFVPKWEQPALCKINKRLKFCSNVNNHLQKYPRYGLCTLDRIPNECKGQTLVLLLSSSSFSARLAAARKLQKNPRILFFSVSFRLRKLKNAESSVSIHR